LIPIVANAHTPIYARSKQILTISRIVLEELKIKTLNNTFHTWWHEQHFLGGFYCN